ncbi:tetratricopeptide repeat protein [bacterium]|nr:tetratricopeptide repeat protein [bacterium]
MKKFFAAFVLMTMMLIVIGGCEKKPTAEEMFTQAKSYQENQDFQKAVDTYEKIIELYPNGKLTDKAQFMIGFVYANNMNDVESARSAYKKFLDVYGATADSGMVASANWELENIGKDINEIEALKNLTTKEGMPKEMK